jgi:hypothetical protein
MASAARAHPHLYVRYEDRAVQHLFEVAAGLDSMVVGEQQILARSAARCAPARLETIGQLNDLPRPRCACARAPRHRHRPRRRFGRQRRSALAADSSAALPQAGPRGRRWAMSGLAAATLQRAASAIVVANRTERGQHLAEQVGGRCVDDVVPPRRRRRRVLLHRIHRPVLTTADVATARAGRRAARVVDPRSRTTPRSRSRPPRVTRIGLASLVDVLEAHAPERDSPAHRRRRGARAPAAPLPSGSSPFVRSHADQVVEIELDRLRLALPGSARPADIARHAALGVTLLHRPTVRIAARRRPDGARYATTLHRLFDSPRGDRRSDGRRRRRAVHHVVRHRGGARSRPLGVRCERRAVAPASLLAAQSGLSPTLRERPTAMSSSSRTRGDADQTTPLASFGGVGVFVTAVRDAVLRGEADVAVHSLKDLPTQPAAGLQIAAIPLRQDPRDVLVARDGLTLETLPAGARVGTGSPRRAAQLLALRPDLDVVALRGNVDTRVRAVTDGALDADARQPCHRRDPGELRGSWIPQRARRAPPRHQAGLEDGRRRRWRP